MPYKDIEMRREAARRRYHTLGYREWHRRYVKQDRVRTYINTRNAQIRLEVLTHYSNGIPRCACCGERTLQFLGIDHVEGGGSTHRQNINGHICSWLKRNFYPEGYQVLCHNCNLAKGFYGECPHE